MAIRNKANYCPKETVETSVHLNAKFQAASNLRVTLIASQVSRFLLLDRKPIPAQSRCWGFLHIEHPAACLSQVDSAKACLLALPDIPALRSAREVFGFAVLSNSLSICTTSVWSPGKEKSSNLDPQAGAFFWRIISTLFAVRSMDYASRPSVRRRSPHRAQKNELPNRPNLDSGPKLLQIPH